MRTLFVDGYNVINSWPNLKRVKEYSYESSRLQLIGILQNYLAFKGYNIFIVFDAQLVKGSIQKKEKTREFSCGFYKRG